MDLQQFGMKFATDEKLENEGVWVKIEGDFEGLICRHGNPKYEKAFRDALKKFQPEEGGEITAEHLVSATITAYQQGILIDWRGLFDKAEEDENGPPKPVPYSVELAEKFLALKDFRDRIYRLSNNRRHFADKDFAKRAAGN